MNLPWKHQLQSSIFHRFLGPEKNKTPHMTLKTPQAPQLSKKFDTSSSILEASDWQLSQKVNCRNSHVLPYSRFQWLTVLVATLLVLWREEDGSSGKLEAADALIHSTFFMAVETAEFCNSALVTHLHGGNAAPILKFPSYLSKFKKQIIYVWRMWEKI